MVLLSFTMRAFHLLHALWVVVAIARPIEREASERYDFYVMRTESRRLLESLLNMLMTHEGIQRKQESSTAFLSIPLFRQSSFHILEVLATWPSRRRVKVQAPPSVGEIPRSSDGTSVEGVHTVPMTSWVYSLMKYPRPLLLILFKSGWGTT